MIQPLAPRGPDGQGRWSARKDFWTIALAHRRLAILDLSDSARQPMQRGKLSVVYNGEIYNCVELRRELESLGHAFLSHGDTEVLLAAYEQWGESCLARFNGMFAFALWDARRGELFCTRDRAGERPFYYYCDGRRLVFASEIKAVLAFGPPVPRHPSEKGSPSFSPRTTEPCGRRRFLKAFANSSPAGK